MDTNAAASCMGRAVIVPVEAPEPPPRRRRPPKRNSGTIRKADVLRVIRAATSAGMPVKTLEVTREGTIRVSSDSPVREGTDVFEQWESKL